MAVYGDLRFVEDAVTSVVRQEFRDFELILVDDGSGARALLEGMRDRDPRIRLIENPRNLGAAAAGNRGIAEARSDLIVRLDADDLAEPSRIGRLVAALDADSRVGLVGSAVTLIDEAGQPLGTARMPETDLEIRWTILFHNPFYHSAAAFRKHCFEQVGGYREHEAVSHDHYLWFELLKICRGRNLPDVLTRYRLNSLGLTAVHSRNARSRTHAIREAVWKEIGLDYDLYDDAIARPVTEFLRGSPIAPERRLAAYRIILSTLRRFLAAADRTPERRDHAAAAALRRRIVGRMLSELPDARPDRLDVLRRCWALSPAAVLRTAAGSLRPRRPR